jgi:hypothetical protein
MAVHDTATFSSRVAGGYWTFDADYERGLNWRKTDRKRE